MSELDNIEMSVTLTPMPDISSFEGRGGGGPSQEIGDDMDGGYIHTILLQRLELFDI